MKVCRILLISIFLFSLTFISAETFGYNYLEEGKGLNPTLNYSTINVNNSQYLNWKSEGALDVNSADFWDALDSPSDILTSLINNDLSWLNAGGIEGVFNSSSFKLQGTNVILANSGDSVIINGKLDVNSSTENAVRIVGTGTPLPSTYTFSIQNNAGDGDTWFEILNGIQSRGAFFGMSNNDFELWNWQGGVTKFMNGATGGSASAVAIFETTATQGSHFRTVRSGTNTPGHGGLQLGAVGGDGGNWMGIRRTASNYMAFDVWSGSAHTEMLTLESDGDVLVNVGNLKLGDSQKLYLGDAGDGSIQYDGANTLFTNEVGSGDFIFDGNLAFQGTLNSSDTTQFITFNSDGIGINTDDPNGADAFANFHYVTPVGTSYSTVLWNMKEVQGNSKPADMEPYCFNIFGGSSGGTLFNVMNKNGVSAFKVMGDGSIAVKGLEVLDSIATLQINFESTAQNMDLILRRGSTAKSTAIIFAEDDTVIGLAGDGGDWYVGAADSGDFAGSGGDEFYIGRAKNQSSFWIELLTGFIGINGITNPTHEFNVNGSANITENLIVGGNITGNQYYAQAHYHNETPTSINFAVQDLFYNLTWNEEVGKELNGFTSDGTHTLTCQVAGLYSVNQRSTGSGQNNHMYASLISVNGIPQTVTVAGKKMSAGGDVTTLKGAGEVRLAVGDTINLQIKDNTGTGTGDYYGMTLNLVRIGE